MIDGVFIVNEDFRKNVKYLVLKFLEITQNNPSWIMFMWNGEEGPKWQFILPCETSRGTDFRKLDGAGLVKTASIC